MQYRTMEVQFIKQFGDELSLKFDEKPIPQNPVDACITSTMEVYDALVLAHNRIKTGLIATVLVTIGGKSCEPSNHTLLEHLGKIDFTRQRLKFENPSMDAAQLRDLFCQMVKSGGLC